MDYRKNLAKALSGVLVGGMLLSFGGAAFAGDVNSSVIKDLNSKSSSISQAMKDPGKMFKNKQDFRFDKQGGLLATLDQLVKDGIITQDKVDEIKAYMEKAAQEREARREEVKNLSTEERKALQEKWLAEKSETKPVGKPDLLNELVNNNILSQEQADAIKTKIVETAREQKQQQISEGLKAIVDEGTITQEQADKILKQLEDVQKNQEELFEITKDMTAEDRREYMQNNKEKLQNPLSQLVADGTITQEQAKAIGKILHYHKGY